MNDLIVAGTATSPEVEFTCNGKLKLKGNSVLDFPETYFEPMKAWIEEYCNEPAANTEIDLNLIFSTVDNNKFIYGLLKKLNDLNGQGQHISINWHYEEKDDEMKDLGQFWAAKLGEAFHLMPYYQLADAEID